MDNQFSELDEALQGSYVADEVEDQIQATDEEEAAPEVAPQPQEQAQPDQLTQMMQGAQDWVAEKLLGRSEEESQQLREENYQKAQELQQRIDQDKGVLAEGSRAVIGGLAGVVESAGQTTELVGDTVKTIAGVADESDNVFGDAYEKAEWDLGVSENKTAVGKFAREMVTLAVTMRQAGRFIKSGQAVTRTGRIGRAALEGAIADLIVSDDDSNLSNMVSEAGPIDIPLTGLSIDPSNPLSTTLAINDDDGPWSARIKNMVEGGVFGVAVDGVGELLGALSKGRAARKAGATEEEAVKIVLEEMEQLELKTGNVKAKPEKTLGAHDVFMEASEGDYSRLNQLNAKELRSLMEDYDLHQFASPRDILQNVDPFVSYEAMGEAIFNKQLPNGSNIEWSLRDISEQFEPVEVREQDLARAEQILNSGGIEHTFENLQQVLSDMGVDQVSSHPLEGRKVNRIDWNISDADAEAGGLGRDAPKMFKQFSEVVSDTLKPGDIMMTEAAEDGFGAAGMSGAQARAADGHNVRQSLYERAGFSPADEMEGRMYGIVRMDKKGRARLEPMDINGDIDQQIADATRSKYEQSELELEAGYRPGYKERLDMEDFAGNHNKPGEPVYYEPPDAAGRVTDQGIERAFVSQASADGARGMTSAVSASPVLTDAALAKIVEPRMMQDANYHMLSALESTVKEHASKIDVQYIAKQMGQTWEQTTYKALRAIHEFIGASDISEADGMKIIEGLTANVKDAADEYSILTREGVVVAKTLIGDAAYQINDLAGNIMDGAANAADATRQIEMLGNRIKMLSRLHKVTGYHHGSGLNAFKIGGLNFGNKNLGDIHKQIKADDSVIDDLVSKARSGDPGAIQEAKNLANGLAMAQGDPAKTMNFWKLFRAAGGRVALQGMYNSMLSSPLTHTRNLAGNLGTLVTRPVTMAIGRGMNGDFAGAKAAIGSYAALSEAMPEAWQMFNSAWKSGVSGAKAGQYSQNADEVTGMLTALKEGAKNDAEKGFVRSLEKWNNLYKNPWFTAPTRALTASDDMFKTLVTRMEIRREVLDESLVGGTGVKFDPKRYAQLVNQKIGINGEIMDEKLMEVADAATFQTKLKGLMAQVNHMSGTNPAMQVVIPFVRTPHNLFVYNTQHLPIVNRWLVEWDETMSGTDEVAKAILRGREAMGWMVTGTGFTLASQGLITGNGPVDPDKRKLWLKTHQPNSIKVGNKWVSYQPIMPLNLVFSLVADTQQLLAAGETDLYERSKEQFAYAVASSIYNQSYFKGLGAAMEMFNPNVLARGETMEKNFFNTVNSFIPFSGARRQLAGAMNPAMNEYRNELDKALGAAVPGYDAAVGFDKVDSLTGKTINSYHENPINWILPFSLKDPENDYVVQQMTEYGIDYEAALESVQSVKLEASERNAINKLTAKQGIRKELERHFRSKRFATEYKNWVAKREAGNTSKPEDAWWYEEATKIIQAGRTAAIEEFKRENEDFDARVFQARQDRYNAGQGTIDELFPGFNY